jgi:signal peptidase I
MRTWFKAIGWVVGVVGAVLLALYIVFFDVWTISTDDPTLAAAIEPTLSAGEIVVLSRRTEVGRGNLLRCADPQAPGRFVIARAMARVGEHVDIANETVAIDGHRNPSPRACDAPRMLIHNVQSGEDETLACSVEDYGEMTYTALRSLEHPEPPTSVVVDPGRWYLVSDDRHVHLDSRDFGQIDPNTCQHILFRLVGAAGIGDRARRLSIIW